MQKLVSIILAVAILVAGFPGLARADGPGVVGKGVPTYFGAPVLQSGTPTDGQFLGYTASTGVWSAITVSAGTTVTTLAPTTGSAASAGAFGTAVGVAANASGNSSTALGNGAASSAANALALGSGSSASASNATALGTSATANAGSAIALGSGALAGGIGSFVAGSNTAPITDGYFGNGLTNATPQSFTLHSTGSSANGTSGASFSLAGGLANQAADSGGDLNFKVAVSGTGTTLTTIMGIAAASATTSITNNLANNNAALSVTKNPVGAQSGNAFSVTMGATTTGGAALLQNVAGATGSMLLLRQNTSSAAGAATMINMQGAPNNGVPNGVNSLHYSISDFDTTATVAGGGGGILWGANFGGGGGLDNGAAIRPSVENATDHSCALLFFTHDSSNATNPVQNFAISGVGQINIGGLTPNGGTRSTILTTSAGVYGFANGTGSSATIDTGISRESAGIIDIGSGAAGDTSGTIKCTTLAPTQTGANNALIATCTNLSGTAIQATGLVAPSGATGLIHSTFQPNINDGGAGTATGTYQVVRIHPTINCTSATRSGHYEALTINPVETSNLTGTNYLIRCFAGSAGTTEEFSITNAGKPTVVNGLTTAGLGVPTIVGAANITAQTTNATITSYANGAADGDFEVSGQVSVTAATTISTTIQVVFTDVSNTSRTITLDCDSNSGVNQSTITTTGVWCSFVHHIRAKASTTITLQTGTGTFTGVTYSASGAIRQLQ